MRQHRFYSGLGELVYQLKEGAFDLRNFYPVDHPEVLNFNPVKPYRPYKNLGIILTRLESHLMHEVYLQFDHWILLVHDALIIEEIYNEELKELMIHSALDQGYIVPKVSAKLANS